ncbi:MAG TPA: alpha/beta fold hydrolase [Thermoanaerobaculia bacterium]|nr:alpha/beta fold hydrolase [Thermoanaerobaculia bacterium]
MKTLIFFVHGFSGGIDTWGNFKALLESDPELEGCTVCEWSYPTTLNPGFLITKWFWSDDPNIPMIGSALRTKLRIEAANAQRVVLVAHSMGGLVVQAFVIEELERQSTEFLGHITDVILCGTPSAGLGKGDWGAFLKNQISDMAAQGEFVKKLRAAWKTLVDDKRADERRLAAFRLTLVAGLRDRFVPPETSVGPFPLDAKEFVPGDHVEMVKPRSREDTIYAVLKQRLLNSPGTEREHSAVAAAELELMGQVRAARELENAGKLRKLADEVRNRAPRLPRVERELGLALLGQQDYALAVDLLRAYLASANNVQRREPDVQAVQQLAIALSGTGDHTAAVAELQKLGDQWRSDPETLGIIGGRIKREWLLDPSNLRLAFRARNSYLAGLTAAMASNDTGQIVYNGINAAYLSFVLEDPIYTAQAQQVLAAAGDPPPDYWTLASRAEAHLLLGDMSAAEKAYRAAKQQAAEQRHWDTTRQQALNIGRQRELSPALVQILG